MNAWLVDTNVIANLAAEDMNVPRYVTARDALEARSAGPILSLEDAVVRRWGAISGRATNKTGRDPPVIDTLQAATAIVQDLDLVSRKAEYLVNSGAAIFDPWRDDVAAFPLAPIRRR